MLRYKYLFVVSLIIFSATLATPGLVYAAGYTANGVVGHIAFDNSYANDAPNNTGFNYPQSVAIDAAHHRLFVSDKYNCF